MAAPGRRARVYCGFPVPMELPEPVARTIANAPRDVTPLATISRKPLSSEPASDSPATEESLPRISLGGSVDGYPGKPSSADLELIGLLGEGGRGRVMLARQQSVGREVAVKIARDREHGNAALRVEARTMGRLEHPNVVPVHAIGVDDEGDVVLVMKHIEGVDWRTLLRDPSHAWWERLEVPPSERQSFHLDVLAQIANALHFAHGRGVIHRDVKPENVLIGAYGDVYLSDWGVASLPQEREEGSSCEIVGTPAYMAPEMVMGEPQAVDARTDVFLLGATLHEILVGKPRYPARSVEQALMAAFQCEPFEYPDTIPEELAALARAATAREPSARPESALAFRRALDDWRVHRGAMTLTRRARELAAEARSLRERRGREALADIDRKLVEARFGFMQALREWPEHEPAREGLREVLVMAVENELARESIHTVRARLAELDDPPSLLLAAVESLEAKHAAEREERARLVALERDLDLSIASSERRVFVGVVLAVACATLVFAVARLALVGRRVIGQDDLIAFAAIMLTASAGCAVYIRRRTKQNTAGMSLLVAFLTGMGAVLANRMLGAHMGTPVPAILATDCVIYAAVLVSTRSVTPRLVWLAPWLLVGAIAVTSLPSFAPLVFSTALLTMLAALFVGWSWFMRPATRAEFEPEARP